ncbi:tubulin polyglutamylase TTLL7 isoform X1 [Brachionus plicatilis]|uniref:Tubulin polyglutamylase TTLL7 isoform X1 n=1 Tax=Brachionus plicatilis TaxID=10195 RepID=A0A3M7PW11_BRAPC|nr:tubulin polyglutamylase TTLL7 isoform X1 [Brachionus plicatilis]
MEDSKLFNFSWFVLKELTRFWSMHQSTSCSCCCSKCLIKKLLFEDELLYELAECDDEFYDESDYDQYKKINEYLKDDYITSDTEESQPNSDNEENEYHHSRHHDVYYQNHYHKHNLDPETDRPSETRSTSVDSFRNRNEEINDENLTDLKLNSGKRISVKSLVQTENIKQNRVNTLLNSVINTKISKPLGRKSTELEHKTSEIANANRTEQLELLKQMRRHQNKQSIASTSNPLKSRDSHPEQDDLSNNNISTLTIACLKLLNQLEIKFPGKTNQQTRNILQKIYSKLDSYKPKLADYWMVKLDDSKRTKIINIVKSNVIVILQKVFMVDSVENLRIYKIFIKLFNRLLWMHGQGLWNCFGSSNSTWESIFNKSSFQISENELKCCYRVVELCKDCVIIVYQYAFENKPNYEKRDSTLNQSSKYRAISLTSSNLSLAKNSFRIKLAFN